MALVYLILDETDLDACILDPVCDPSALLLRLGVLLSAHVPIFSILLMIIGLLE